MLQVRATPIAEDGTSGDTITITDVDSYRYDPEQPDSPAAALEQLLVAVTVTGDQYWFPLIAHHNDNGDWVTGHVIEIIPAPAPADDETDNTDHLLDEIDRLRAEEEQRASELRDQITEIASERGWSTTQLQDDFQRWSNGAQFDQVSFVVLADYLEYLQAT